ncbi:putative minor tail protein Z [Pseudomonas phage PPpW-3]|uniref:Putative minor tail protein Z n=1 Tax=Pseudomonas phage PPpW-3 TaxID=1279082 RepID=V5YTM6_9CAUD|nr:tail completion or Neck1 protein [Pseudomonas phage PPpW-3]BAO20609.1 putative minor tail protein Z [Pseudomonas phage PPpW-3]
MLQFDLDWRELVQVGEELQATDKQVMFALSRAMRRTEATLRRISAKGLVRILQLRTASILRKRLKSIKMRKGGLDKDGAGLWYGLNDLPVSSFKGRPSATKDGASFRGTEYDGAFVGRSKVKGKQTIFKRVKEDRLPVAEQLHSVEDKAIVFIEDEVFDQVLDIFWEHFKRDLRARVKFKLGES